VLQAIQIQAQTLSVTAGDWVKETQTFNVTAITRFAGISYVYMIKWALFCTATSQTNGYHCKSFLYDIRKMQVQACLLSLSH